MKIEVNIEKRYFYLILSVIILSAGVLIVGAFDPAGLSGTFSGTKESAVVMGHSADEMVVDIGGVKYTLQNAIAQGKIGGGSVDWSQTIPSAKITNLNATSINSGGGNLRVDGLIYDGRIHGLVVGNKITNIRDISMVCNHPSYSGSPRGDENIEFRRDADGSLWAWGLNFPVTWSGSDGGGWTCFSWQIQTIKMCKIAPAFAEQVGGGFAQSSGSCTYSLGTIEKDGNTILFGGNWEEDVNGNVEWTGYSAILEY